MRRTQPNETKQAGRTPNQIAVAMGETDGRGRKSVNMIPAVWIETDGALPRELPLAPTIAIETSQGHRHYVYMARDLTWDVWHGIQQFLIADYGSDRRAAHRTQVLRLPGTLHLEDPAHPHLVQIVEDLTSERIYTVAEIAVAFPPRPSTSRSRHRDSAARVQRAGHGVELGAEWDQPSILATAIDARLQKTGPFIAQGVRPGDKAIPVHWSRRDCWKDVAPRLRSGMPSPGNGITACRSPGQCPRGRKLRPPTPGGIPGFRECTMTTKVPCLSLRHGICSASAVCRRWRASQLSSASPRGQVRNRSWRAAYRSIVHQHPRRCRWLRFDVHHSNEPSPMVGDLVVVDQAAPLLEVDGHA
jgi:hypothetical protein